MDEPLDERRQAGFGFLPLGILLIGGYAVFALVLSLSSLFQHSMLPKGVGIGLTVFCSGYAILAVFYPAETESGDEPLSVRLTAPSPTQRVLTRSERFLLAVATSILLTQLLWVLLTVSPVAETLQTLVIASAAVTVLAVGTALSANSSLGFEDFYLIGGAIRRTIPRWPAVIRGSGANRAVSAVLVLTLLVGSAAVLYGLTLPTSQDEYTELSLLTVTQDGEMVAGNYTEGLDSEDSKAIAAHVRNHEGETVEYAILVRMQDLRRTDSGFDVVDTRELQRDTVVVPANDTVTREYRLGQRMRGELHRVEVLLYRGRPPVDPTRANAYRSTYVLTNGTGQN